MKIKILPILLAVLLFTASCEKGEDRQNMENTTGKDDGIVYSEPNTDGTTVTYILTSSGYIPMSLCEGGYNMLSGENYYYNIENSVSNCRDLADKKYTAFTDGGINLGDTAIDGKSDAVPLYTLATTANWKLCPNLRKTVYKKEKADSNYAEFIFKSFPDNFKSAADVKITDTWEYDLDADGAGEAVVRASSEGFTVLALLSQTLGNKILASSFIPESEYVAVPFFADLDGNGVYSLVTVWGDGLKTVSVYKENSLEEEYRVYLPI